MNGFNSLPNKYFNAVLIAIMIVKSGFSQIQKGPDINGQYAGEKSGHIISMPHATTIAIGAPYNNEYGENAGKVRIYQWNNSAWMLKGQGILGVAAGDMAGWSVNMPDANTVAIGQPYHAGNGTNAGQVSIYRWNGSSWVQKGSSISGESAGDLSGWSVSMPDANTVAIGAVNNDGAGSNAGHVRVFTWSDTDWVQRGSEINGETAQIYLGGSVVMPDANTLAVSSSNTEASDYRGRIRVYFWNGTDWSQKGLSLDGEAAEDYSGHGLSMPDSNTIAIGAYANDGIGFDCGHVRVFSWNGSSWIQKGLDLDGQQAGDQSGYSVSMPTANMIAIGAMKNNANGVASGNARLFSWNGVSWVQTGQDIAGEAAGDWFGYSVSMPDSNTVAIGAYTSDATAADAGQVKVYELVSTVGTTEKDLGWNPTTYPNPSKGGVTIEVGPAFAIKFCTVKNAIGQTVVEQQYSGSTYRIEMELPAEPGVYFLEISSDSGQKARVKIVKE